MARTKTNSVVEEVVDNVENTEITSFATEEIVEEKKSVKKSTKQINQEPLEDYEEIDVISLVPNVSYKDEKTGDMYEWDVVDHIEPMTFEVLKNMWRNNKGYFRNMYLKPCDERVINKFGLTKTFEKYEYLMDGSNYTEDNIEDICKAISNTPNGLKVSLYNKIKNLVMEKEIVNISVVKKIEKRLKIDLIEFL